MAKTRTPNQKKAYNALNARLTQYVAQVQGIYDMANRKMAEIAVSSGHDGTEVFSFSDYPEFAEAVKDVQAQFVSEMRTTIYRGTGEEWKQSNLIQDLLAEKVLKSYSAQVHGKRYRQYFQTNSDALKAFQNRAERGMNLSAKLWNQSALYKEEMEAAISIAIQNGMSAQTLSKRLSVYLEDFPQLQKDYREKFGRACICQDCEYRSIRLARSEINMAYRTAEQERWRQFDFVLGYEIKLSGSHPHTDICDDLKGRYPKDFVWTGWHPNDMCYSIPIIMSEDEYWKEGDRSKSGEMITELPQNFKDFVIGNNARIKAADKNGTLPYFLRDNPEFRKYMGTDYVTEWRHRTRDSEAIQTAAINRQAIMENGYARHLAKLRREARYVGYDMSDVENLISGRKLKFDNVGICKELDDSMTLAQAGVKESRKELNDAFVKVRSLMALAKSCVGKYRMKSVIDEMDAVTSGYDIIKSPYGRIFSKKAFDKVYSSANRQIKANAMKLDATNESQLEKAIGLKKGHPMSFDDADTGRGNIHYKTGGEPYSSNCQTCVVVDELRRRGYDVTAVGFSEDSITKAIARSTNLPWMVKGRGWHPLKNEISMTRKTDNEIYGAISEATKRKGRYHMDFKWKDEAYAHIVCIERRSNGMLRFYDPQTGEKYDLLDWIGKMDKKHTVNILRVDDLLADPDIIRQIVKPLKK